MDKIIIDAERKMKNEENAVEIINSVINEIAEHVSDLDKQLSTLESMSTDMIF